MRARAHSSELASSHNLVDFADRHAVRSMADIFISYARKDSRLAEDLARDLECRGYSVWWDTRAFTKEFFAAEIRDQIRAAAAVIVIWTKASAASQWVHSEALEGQEKLFPVRVPDLDPQIIPLPFTSTHAELLQDRKKIYEWLEARGVRPGQPPRPPSIISWLERWLKRWLSPMLRPAALLIAGVLLWRFIGLIPPPSPEPKCDTLSFACIKQKKIIGQILTNVSNIACKNEVTYIATDPAIKWKAIWTTNLLSYVESNKGPGGGQYNEELRIGGWGDLYYSLIQFDPPITRHIEFAGLLLFANYSEHQPVSMYLDRITAPWGWKEGDRLWWKDKPHAIAHYGGQLPAPEPGKWYLIDVTGVYNWWLGGNQPNYGIQLRPTANWNQLNHFSSALEKNADRRPRLILCN
jgi:hypothetical protein